MSGDVNVYGGVGWLAIVIAIALLTFSYDIRCALGNQPACEAAAKWFAAEMARETKP